MREKLNSNPTLQIALIGILALVAAYFFLLRGGGESEEGAATAEAPAVAEAPATAEAVPGAAAPVAGTTPVAAISSAPDVPTPPLPASIVRAYKSSKTIVLLVVRGGGVDDPFVTQAVESLAPLNDVEVVVTRAKHIARYAAITLGVDVERVPALIVVRPRRLSDGNLQASVSYGYQSPQSVVQAVTDASYTGPEPAYHPN